MQNDPFTLMQRLAPDLVTEIERRALVLERIDALQPVGRRQLSVRLGIPEREVRSIAALLKDHGLISLDAAGMSLTREAQDILPAARAFSRELSGLTRLEAIISEKLNVNTVCVVSGNYDMDAHILSEVGKCAAQHLRSHLQTGNTLAVAGGSTVAAVASALTQGSKMNIMVVPARGGIGLLLEKQANTVASEIAKRLAGNLRLLHLPDRVDDQTLEEMRKLREVDEALTLLERADVILHGIGRADVMMETRQLSEGQKKIIVSEGAVGESCGRFYDINGREILLASAVAHHLGNLKPQCSMIAVAAGSTKAEAVIGTMRNHPHSLLVIDEGLAKALVSLLNQELPA